MSKMEEKTVCDTFKSTLRLRTSSRDVHGCVSNRLSMAVCSVKFSVLFLQGQLNDRPDHPTLPLEEYINCTSNQIIGALRHKDQTYNWLGNGVNSKRTSLIEWQNTLDIFNKQGIYIRCNNFAIGRDIIKQFPKEYYQNIGIITDLFYQINLTLWLLTILFMLNLN